MKFSNDVSRGNEMNFQLKSTKKPVDARVEAVTLTIRSLRCLNFIFEFFKAKQGRDAVFSHSFDCLEFAQEILSCVVFN
jgi:hypothetical protein